MGILLTTINIQNMIFYIFGGLGIFLYGLHIMGESLKNLAGAKLKILIEKTTNTPLKGILMGIVITVLIQSSSGTTALTVGLIGAGLMTLPQAIAVIIGANIGTTVTSFLIGLKIANYALPMIGIGAFAIFFSKRKRISLMGSSLMGFGMLFFGLEMMGVQLKVLTTLDFFETLMVTLSTHPILGVIVGTSLTALVQSSSASIGILQQLYSTGTIPLLAAIPILLGSNIGTTVTAILASLGSSKDAKRTALAHVYFNLLGTIAFLFFLKPYTRLFTWIETTYLEAGDKLTIAFAHMGFNILTTFIMFFLIKYLVKAVEKSIPKSPSETFVVSVDQLNHTLIQSAPILALENAKKVISDMGCSVLKMFKITKDYINYDNHKYFEDVSILENITDTYDNKCHDYLVKLSGQSLSKEEQHLQSICFDTIRDFERIADHCFNIAEFMHDRYDNKVVANPSVLEDLNTMVDALSGMLSNAIGAFQEFDKQKAYLVMEEEPNIDAMEKKYRKSHLKLVSDGVISSVDLHFVDILANLERIGDHAENIAENLLNESIHDIED
jgi:phosphate:Na+ symporter